MDCNIAHFSGETGATVYKYRGQFWTGCSEEHYNSLPEAIRAAQKDGRVKTFLITIYAPDLTFSI